MGPRSREGGHVAFEYGFSPVPSCFWAEVDGVIGVGYQVEVAEAIGRPQHDVVLAMNNLGHKHLIVKDSSTYDGPDNYVTGIRPEGLEATGQWPSSDVAAEGLIAALDALVDNAPEDSPKHKRLVAARNGLLGVGRDVLVNVGSAVITGQLYSSS